MNSRSTVMICIARTLSIFILVVSLAGWSGAQEHQSKIGLNPTVKIGYSATLSLDKRILAWEAEDGRSVAIFVEDNGVRRLARNISIEAESFDLFALSPQGNILAVVNLNDETIEVYSVETGKKIHALSFANFHPGGAQEDKILAFEVLDEAGTNYVAVFGMVFGNARITTIRLNLESKTKDTVEADVKLVAPTIDWYFYDHYKSQLYTLLSGTLSRFDLNSNHTLPVWQSEHIDFPRWNAGVTGPIANRENLFGTATGGVFSNGDYLFLCSSLNFGEQAWIILDAVSGSAVETGVVKSSYPDDIGFLSTGCISVDYKADHFLIDQSVGADLHNQLLTKQIDFLKISMNSPVDSRERLSGPDGLTALIGQLDSGYGSYIEVGMNSGFTCTGPSGFERCFDVEAPPVSIFSEDFVEKHGIRALSFQDNSLLLLDVNSGDVSIIDMTSWLLNKRQELPEVINTVDVRTPEIHNGFKGPYGIALDPNQFDRVYLKGPGEFVSAQLRGKALVRKLPQDQIAVLDPETNEIADFPLESYEEGTFALHPSGRSFARCNLSQQRVELVDIKSGELLSSSVFLPRVKSAPINENIILADYCEGLQFIERNSQDAVVFKNPQTQQLVLHKFGDGAELLFDRQTSPFIFAPSGETAYLVTDSGTLAAHELSTKSVVWSTKVGEVINEIVLVDDQNAILIIGHEWQYSKISRRQQYYLAIVDADSGKLLKRFNIDNEPAHRAMLSSYDSMRLIAYQTSDNRLVFISRSSEVPVAFLTLFGAASTWVVNTPDGLYDSNYPAATSQLSWSSFDRPMEPLPLEAFFREYYTPGLLGKVLRGEALPDLPAIQDLDRTQPELAILAVEPELEGTVTVRVLAQSVPSQFEAGRYTGVEGLRLIRDGQMVDEALLDADAILSTSGKEKEIIFNNIQLPSRLEGGSVEFSAYAFSEAGIKSRTVRLQHETGDVTPVTRKAYVLAVGVDAYDDPTWDLEYAAADAREYVDRFSRGIEVDGEIIEEVAVIPLISHDKRSPGEATATAENIETVLRVFAGVPADAAALARIPGLNDISRVRPDDVVVIAFSGHGYAGDDGQFYFFPQDIPAQNGREITPQLLDRAISSRELRSWVSAIDAGQFVMIIDACNSGASVAGLGGFRPGPLGSREFGQLAYDKKMTVLAASSAESIALESDEIGHGLLTYALLKEGVEGEFADTFPRDGRVSLLEMLEYGETRVPKLYEEISTRTFEPLYRGERASTPVFTDTDTDHLTSGAFQPIMFNFSENQLAQVSVR